VKHADSKERHIFETIYRDSRASFVDYEDSSHEESTICTEYYAPCLSYDAAVQGTVPFTDGMEINAQGQVVGINIGDQTILSKSRCSGKLRAVSTSG